MTDVAPRSTKRHWRVLRNALLSRTRDASADTTASSLSTGFFPVFDAEAVSRSEAQQTEAENFEWRRYNITQQELVDASASATTMSKHVLIHEKQKRQRVSVAELLSHKVNAGVDNTGNIRTWPCEQVLLAYLLKNDVCKALSKLHGGRKVRCMELGSGMAGLAAIGLVAHEASTVEEMIVTDGNPQSVENLHVCIAENVAQGLISSSTTADLLRWDRTHEFRSTQRHQFDLVFASDCLFFEEFHQDLAYTIAQLLKPDSGMCYLLQPSRNGSMERFCEVAAKMYSLEIEICRDFDESISKKHILYLETRQDDYVPDVHLPILVRIRSHPLACPSRMS